MNLLVIQILIPAFALFVVLSAGRRWRKREMSTRAFVIWLLLWMGVSVVVLLPQTTGILARLLGVGRGVDVIVYIAIVVLVYLFFRLYMRMERIERDITKLVREIALKNDRKS